MNIMQEGYFMQEMLKNKEKPEEMSLSETEEELQDTLANGRRLIVDSTAKGAT
jgi:hypothetical protein